jgi:hypothetical protein
MKPGGALEKAGMAIAILCKAKKGASAKQSGDPPGNSFISG